jgi:hypothetical protein
MQSYKETQAYKYLTSLTIRNFLVAAQIKDIQSSQALCLDHHGRVARPNCCIEKDFASKTITAVNPTESNP